MPPALFHEDSPVHSLSGVGQERAAQLARLGIRTVSDLLLHRPRRYEDRRQFIPIHQIEMGGACITRGRILAQGLKRFAKGTKSVFEFVIDDGTARLHCRWWNLPFMEKYFAVGDEVLVYGRPIGLKPRTIDHPETEVVVPGEEISIHMDRIAPVYPLTEGLPQRWLRSLIWRALEQWENRIVEPWSGRVLERSPSGDHPPTARFPHRADALRLLHFPEDIADAALGRERLALDEFIDLQCTLLARRRRLEAKARAMDCRGTNEFIRPFLKKVGFTLTAGQTEVLREIRQNLGEPRPMRRLLQGDVGSGKTVVAACAALMALECDFNAVLMAPTEILAWQHYQNFQRWFAELPIRVDLQTGSSKTMAATPDGARSLPVFEKAGPQLIIGTHALLEDSVTLPRLGLVIIDEQHKFGVAQREKLLRKGVFPHLLVMTATPIPRTLGLTVYGDLDISVIRERPGGRGAIKTYVRGPESEAKVWAFVRQQLEKGRQAYVVFARLDEADSGAGIKAVQHELERLRETFAPYQVGLLHGRLKSVEKDAVMQSFQRNRVQVLLATSIIEVGVDVANATVMVIENAEQFGLAQLHQLRGRIGRGREDSFCILLAPAKTEQAQARLAVLEETNDGFRIAEEDLRLRGPGELLGQDQSGLPGFRFGDLTRDGVLLELARELARELPTETTQTPTAGNPGDALRSRR